MPPASNSPRRIYLDQAATSWPKPESVYRAIDQYQRNVGVAAGRGAYRQGADVSRQVAAARQSLAQLIGAGDPRHVVFAFNGTDALNLALHGALSQGGHAVTTVAEHNSVLRPLRHLEESGRVAVTRVACDAEGVVSAADVAAALRSDTRIIALTHASNVTGALQPAAAIGALARERQILFLLDAAQTLGDLPIQVDELQVDLLAAPGHKGLLGPLGTGLLYIRPGIESRLAPWRLGGTGSHSESENQPHEMPDRFEAGNLNVPGILGLAAGVDWLRARGVDDVRRHSLELSERLLSGLKAIDGVQVYGPDRAEQRIGVASFNVSGFAPQETAAALDSNWQIQVRAGLHCAPRMHAALDTLDAGGAVRVSWGPFNTSADIEALLAAVAEIATAVAGQPELADRRTES